ncbi:MAG: dihydroorotate dehydrogenase [Alkalispirochaeta sp.]
MDALTRLRALGRRPQAEDLKSGGPHRVAASGGHRGGGRPVPIATVSGIASTNVGMIEWFDRETSVAMITTKSIQLAPNPGNREPIITEPHPGTFGNAVGLKNPGIHESVAQLTALRRRRKLRALLNVSISGSTPEEFVELARGCSDVADILELNYSCPHAVSGFGADIGRDEAAIAAITGEVCAQQLSIPILVKLTPNVPDIASMAEVAIGAGAHGVSAINTTGPSVYRDPETGEVILSNPPDGRGGRSGREIFPVAKEAIRAIRGRIGPEPLIVGMGGVENQQQVRELVRAGADVVGIGSALARVHQREWSRYLDELGGRPAGGPPCSDGVDAAPSPRMVAVRPAAGMEFRRCAVAERREVGADMFELVLGESPATGPGQAVFLWLPAVGEKPFAPALATPAGSPASTTAPVSDPSVAAGTTFLIKRRGPITRALGALRRGDEVCMRGPYGDRHEPPEHARALLVGGGSGVAALPMIAAAVVRRGGTVESLLAVTAEISGSATIDSLRRFGTVTVIEDRGVPGRALASITDVVTRMDATTVYTVGPEPFMEGSARAAAEAGVPEDRILLSLERPMRCGVGLCGECHHDGLLTCNYGTIVPWKTVTGGSR